MPKNGLQRALARQLLRRFEPLTSRKGVTMVKKNQPRGSSAMYHLAVVAAGVAATVSWAAPSAACGLPPDDAWFVYPTLGEDDVATNAKLMIVKSPRELEVWLHKVVTTDGGAEPADAAAGNSAASNSAAVDGAAIDAIVPANDSDAGGVAVPFEIECLPRAYQELCLITAALEPNTEYRWGNVDPTFDAVEFRFHTGAGERTPQALPTLHVESPSARRSSGGGDCASTRAAQIEASFGAGAEPWVLLSTNPNDFPILIGPGETTASWESIDPEDCLQFQQVNWAGEVSDPNVEVCIPAPSDAGPIDGSVGMPDEAGTSTHSDEDSSHDGDTAIVTSAANGSSTRDSDSEPSATSDGVNPADAGATDAGSPGNASSDGSSGCSCRTAPSAPTASVLWGGLLLGALLTRRRRLG